MENKVAIACVLKTGGDFTISDVARLKSLVDKNVTVPYNFYCLTDYKGVIGCNVIPLECDYKGWWSKIELFRVNLFEEERVVYFDLDTVIVDNIDEVLIQDYSFIGLRPFNPVKAKMKDYAASGILGFRNTGLSFIYEEFKYKRYTKKYYGDQDYMSDALLSKGIKFVYWQDIVPGIYSYKRHISNRSINSFVDARVVCFHGRPRPKEVSQRWLNKLSDAKAYIIKKGDIRCMRKWQGM